MCHYRVTAEEAAHRIVVVCTDQDSEFSGYVELTYDETTVILTAREAVFWARMLITGGTWYARPGTGTGDIAVGLATAAAVLFLMDPAGESPDFGSRCLALSVEEELLRFFVEESERASRLSIEPVFDYLASRRASAGRDGGGW